jgi:hypothetical protein
VWEGDEYSLTCFSVICSGWRWQLARRRPAWRWGELDPGSDVELWEPVATTLSVSPLIVGFLVIGWNMGILPEFLIFAIVCFALIPVLYCLLVKPFSVDSAKTTNFVCILPGWMVTLSEEKDQG